MGRPKQFDREQALDKAVHVFWSRGYDAPTMSDLKAAMGIGRQSLYDTFGDKDELFREALERYLGMSIARSAEIFSDEDGLRAIRTYVMSTAAGLASTSRNGCLMFNTCMQVAPHDAEIERQVMRGVKDLRRRFEAALQRAIDQETIGSDSDVRGLALLLTSQMAGLTVLARSGASKKELRAVAETVLSHLA